VGDGIILSPVLATEEILDSRLIKSVFTVQYTFAAPGTYIIHYISGSNERVVNAASGQDLNFYASTTLSINPALQNNSLSVFTEVPVFTVLPEQSYSSSFAATDADGDSLAYKISLPQGYINPALVGENRGSNFELNARSGLLTWDKPVEPGVYFVVVTLEEWRNGVLLNSIGRYMLLQVAGVPTSVDKPAVIEVKIFPNPTPGQINIHLPQHTEYPIHLELWSLTGQLLVKKQVISPSEPLRIQAEKCTTGTYILWLQTKNLVLTRKVVLAR
jgi:hypothetical protein